MLKDIMKQGKLLSKEQLDEKAGISLDWFQYLQVSHMYQYLVSHELTCLDVSVIDQLLFTKSLPVKGLVSVIYCHMMDDDLKFTLGYQKAWHLELR